nr:retrovirus-related Pol polyprotein from transposon TNT 1-94 [Tanacetum cinerariifolium]
MAARDSDDALVCCVKNTAEDRIMDFGASFHATYCKEELKRFKLRFGMVRLADDKTLDIAGVGDVVLKTFFVRVAVGIMQKFRVAYSRGGMAREGYKSHTLEGSISDEVRYSFRDTKSHQVIQSRDIKFVDSIYGSRSTTNSSILTKPIQKSQVVLVDISKNLAENDSIVSKHGLSSKITQSSGRSSYTSKGSENSGSFEDSARSDEEYSKDRASSKEGGSETPHVRRSTIEFKAPVRYSPSTNYLLLTHNGKPESYSEALSSKESVQWKKAIIEEMVSLEKN